jgi:hypothetical protein
VHPTLGILARFQAFFYASAFSQSDGVPPPAPARVTQTVGQPKCKTKYVFVSQVSFFGRIHFSARRFSIHKNISPASAVALFKLAFWVIYFSASRFSSSRLFRLAVFS